MSGSDKQADEQAMGSALPPYEGRTESGATVDDSTEPDERQQRFANVGEGMRSGGREDPAASPGGRTASPAEEVPAEQVSPTRPQEDPGVGPAHAAGTTRAEDVADSNEAGRTRTGRTGTAERPVGASGVRDHTGINPDKEDPDS